MTMDLKRIISAMFAVALAASAACGEAAAISVSTIKPERRDVVRWIKLPATVEADAEVTLYAKVSGFLKDFSLDVGDIVKPGQVIGKLDAPELEQDVKYAEAQLISARADVQTAEAQLEQIQIRGEDIDAKQIILEAELQKARAEAARSHTQYARTEKLFSGNAATEQEKDFQEDTCKMVDAAVTVAQSRLAALKSERDLWDKNVNLGKVSIEASKGKTAIAQAALERARTWLAYTELKIPQVGTKNTPLMVSKRYVNNGDLIPGASGARSGILPIVALTAMDPVRVIVDIPESDSIGVTAGTPALVSLHAWPKEKAIQGKVSRQGNILASSTRTLRVEIDIGNPDGRIKPGMMANAEISTDVHKAVLAVPASAVLISKQGATVFAIDAGKAKAIKADAGTKDHGWIQIESPMLSETTSIIKDVQSGIGDGTPVEIK